MGCARFVSRSLWLLVLVTTLLSAGRATASPWLPFGPDGGDARRLSADPHDPAHLFLGTATGWIYETRNGGANWRRLAQVGKRDDLVIESIFVDPANPKHLMVGAYALDRPDGGLFISNDGGLTWLNQAEMRGQSVRSLAYARSDPHILVAGSLQGVFRTLDGGLHWKLISPPDSTEIHEIESVAIDPVDPNIIYAGTWHLPWKTTDGGEHWDNIKKGIYDDSDVFSIIVDPKTPSTIYASACSGIYKSLTAGDSFDRIQGIPSTARRTRVLLQDPQRLDVVFAGTTEGLFRSIDAGKTWSRTTGPEVIVNDVAVDASNSQRVLIATDRGGVLASDDGGDTFHPSNGGFSARQITFLKRDSRHPATLYVSVVNDKEWGGVFQSDNGAVNWTQRSEGLQGRDVFALGQAPDGTMIAGTSHGLFRLDEEARVWKRIDDGGPATEETPEAASPTPVLTRPPVPIGRNHFAERPIVAKHTAPAQKKLASQRKPAPGKKGLPSKAARPSWKPGIKAGQKGTPATRRAQLLAAHRKAATVKSASAKPRATLAAPRPAVALQQLPVPALAKPVVERGFDGSVAVIATAADVLLAATSSGLLSSGDSGQTWETIGPKSARDWRSMAAADRNVIAASMQAVQFSADSGLTWVPIRLPETLTRISAVAVEPSGTLWVGGREGVFVSSDGGTTWTTPKNLYVNGVSSLFYDEKTRRVIVTTSGYSGLVFTVQLPQRAVTYTDAGWMLRFARPVGDHLVAATFFDGIVIEPKRLAAPAAEAEAVNP